jgi:site-specific DNA recombinase
MKNKTIERVAGYVRVSSDKQAEEGYSIDEQIERLTAYCKAMDWRIVKIYTDAGYSGGNMNRPALTDLIGASQSHGIDAVVVYKLDRLSRSQRDTLTIIEGFLEHGVDFVSMTENFDTSTPFGKATIGILSVFAQLEREQIKERCSLGRVGRAKEGKYRGGGFVPIGYEYKDGSLIVNPSEAMQIRELHELYQKGESFRTIARIFAEKGYTHKYGSWEVYRVSRVLRNPLYCGYITHKGETFKGEHEPIISEETFQRSQDVHKGKDTLKSPHLGRSMLGGLLFCARCGARYGISRNGGHNSRYQYYCCHSRRKPFPNMVKDPNCQNKNWKKEDLESLVLGEIAKLQNEPLDAPDQDENDAKIPLILAEIEKTDRQKSRLMDLYASGLFEMAELEAKIRPLNDQKERLAAELERIQAEPTKKNTAALVETFSDALEHGDSEQVRILVRALIHKIVIDGEDIDIYWTFG